MKKQNYLRLLNIVCSVSLFVAVTNLPIIYYNFLRMLVFIGCLFIVCNYKIKKIWRLVFVPIAILFNPIIPVFLYLKPYWIPLDILAGILFLLVIFYGAVFSEIESKTTTKQVVKNRNMYNVKY